MPDSDRTPADWQPTCRLAMLKLRSSLLKATRSFFDRNGYMEVETPLLSSDVVVDAHIEPIRVALPELGRQMFLQTSPEAGMKRLLSFGSGSIYQITRSFRRHEKGERHNPEFTMLEWYGVGTTWCQQLSLIEDLIRRLSESVPKPETPDSTSDFTVAPLSERPFLQTTYEDVFRRNLNLDVFDVPISTLQKKCAELTSVGGESSTIDNRDDLLNLLFAECVEPTLGNGHPEFLHDYPISQAALASRNPRDDRTALRFELYWNGVELCNGYQELTDPIELLSRDTIQNDSRSAHDTSKLPGALRMLAAMKNGLPECSGVALGLDRLLMALLQESSISHVMAFPIDRA